MDLSLHVRIEPGRRYTPNTPEAIRSIAIPGQVFMFFTGRECFPKIPADSLETVTVEALEYDDEGEFRLSPIHEINLPKTSILLWRGVPARKIWPNWSAWRTR
ncbi:MAG: hypothetical protein HY319_30625 [Armatimonadetes bacterium]|nr:hypothetical protein [Armatimonadota bacterium]